MEINLSIATRDVDDQTRERVERTLYLALGRFQHRIKRVRVRLEDVNGPRGGVDQRCRIVVRLNGIPDVVIEQLDADLYAALNRAADRAGSAVARRLDRARVDLRRGVRRGVPRGDPFVGSPPIPREIAERVSEQDEEASPRIPAPDASKGRAR